MKKTLILACALIGATSLIGCGGESVAALTPGPLPGGTNPPGTTPPVEPATKMRMLQPGDLWTYRLTGSESKVIRKGSTETTKPQEPITGSLTISVTNEITGLIANMKITERLVTTDSHNNTTVRITEHYVTQALDRTLTETGRRFEGLVLNITGTNYIFPGTFGTGSSAAGQTAFINSATTPKLTGTESSSFTVSNPVQVFAPAGEFKTWQSEASFQTRYDFRAVKERIDLGQTVEVNTILDRDIDRSMTSWWDPELGSFVRRNEAFTLHETIIDDVIQGTNGVEIKIRDETTYQTFKLDLDGTSVNPN